MRAGSAPHIPSAPTLILGMATGWGCHCKALDLDRSLWGCPGVPQITWDSTGSTAEVWAGYPPCSLSQADSGSCWQQSPWLCLCDRGTPQGEGGPGRGRNLTRDIPFHGRQEGRVWQQAPWGTGLSLTCCCQVEREVMPGHDARLWLGSSR